MVPTHVLARLFVLCSVARAPRPPTVSVATLADQAARFMAASTPAGLAHAVELYDKKGCSRPSVPVKFFREQVREEIGENQRSAAHEHAARGRLSAVRGWLVGRWLVVDPQLVVDRWLILEEIGCLYGQLDSKG